MKAAQDGAPAIVVVSLNARVWKLPKGFPIMVDRLSRMSTFPPQRILLHRLLLLAACLALPFSMDCQLTSADQVVRPHAHATNSANAAPGRASPPR